MRPGRSSVLSRLLLIILVAVVAGAAIGSVARDGSKKPKTGAQATVPVAVGDLRLAVPSNWTRVPRVIQVPGLDGPLSLSLQTSRGFAVVAQAPPSDSSLLPAAMVQSLGRAAGRPTTVQTRGSGPVRMLHYAYYLSTQSISAPMDVYVLPTTRDVAILACIGGGADCPQTLAGLRVSRGRILSPGGADTALRSRLSGAIDPLARDRRVLRDQIAAATTPAGRADAATKLGAAYRAAAAALDPMAADTADGVRLQLVMRHLWRDYEALAGAALRDDAASFTRWSQIIATSEGGLERRLARFTQTAA